jgi:hypothetical protein
MSGQDFPNLSIRGASIMLGMNLLALSSTLVSYVATSVACDPKPVEQMPVVCTTSSSDVFEGGS